MEYVNTILSVLAVLSLVLWSGYWVFVWLGFWFNSLRYATSYSTGVVVLNRIGLIDTETEEYFEICRGVRGFRLVLASWIVKF